MQRIQILQALVRISQVQMALETAKLMRMICLAGLALVNRVSTCQENLMKGPHFCKMVRELRKIRMAFLMVTEVASIQTTLCQ